MSRLFLAFANSDSVRLATLTQEDTEVNSVLNYRVAKGDFQVYREQFATRENIVSKLQLFQEDITLFLYSGHAGRDAIELEDGIANADGIAALLGRCPNLKLVVLNGCSTVGQVSGLLAKGIPVVIATNAPVNDQRATQFSIQFFTELSQNRKTIREAFLSAIEVAKVYGTVEHSEIASRAIGASGRSPNEAVWGLYFQDSARDLLDTWRLPAAPNNAVNNADLEKVIAFIYSSRLSQLQALGEDAEGKDAILKRLPYTISEPLRKLLAPNDGSGAKFYDQPSQERYRMLLYVYRAALNFVGFTLMAQVWQATAEKKFAPDDSTKDVLDAMRELIVADFGTDEKRSRLELLKRLTEALKMQGQPLFLTELESALAQLEESTLKVSVDFLEKQVAAGASGWLPDIQNLCIETEFHVANILSVFGFLIRYTLTSIKDINVLFYPGEPEADFYHKVVKLQQSLTTLQDSARSAKTYFKTATVLLEDSQEKSRYLYLSPFLIDENAYTKTPKANLRYFISYDPTTKYFYFKHVSKPDDVLTIKEKVVSAGSWSGSGGSEQNDYFPLINSQFSAFCRTALGKTLENLSSEK